MSFDTLLSAGIETALNRYLSLDPDSAAGMDKLSGRMVAVQLNGLNLTLYFLLGNPVQVMQHYEGEPDTVIRGTPLGLARLGLGDKQSGLFGGEVEIQGNTEVGHRFQNVLEQVDIDWEEQLSQYIGDTPAHQVGRMLRQARDYGRHVQDTLRQDVSEYLREEARLLPSAIEVQNFMDDVDQVREAVDRLEARLTRLERANDSQ